MSASPNKNSDGKPTPPMNQSAPATSSQEDRHRTDSASTVILLLGTIGDTTWRMFIPTIGLTFAGVYADKSFGTKPWLMVAGIVLGSVIAGLLVKRQLQKVNDE